MKKTITAVATTATLALMGPVAAGGTHDHNAWGYGGPHGPGSWGSLMPEYSACKGRQQSPIDIRTKSAIESDLGKIKFNWRESGLNVLNNGHTIQVNYDRGSTIKVNSGKFNLQQLHFHAPSEHALNGKRYDMEAHFVHKAANGEQTIVGVFFKEGKKNPALSPVWDNMPAAGKTNKVPGIKIKASDLLPSDTKAYFHYMGSLTTPPCSEVVNWYILAEPIEMSKAQIKAFSKMIPANNRPVQRLNRRFVLVND